MESDYCSRLVSQTNWFEVNKTITPTAFNACSAIANNCAALGDAIKNCSANPNKNCSLAKLLSSSCLPMEKSCDNTNLNNKCRAIAGNCTLCELKTCAWIAQNCTLSRLKSCPAIAAWRSCSYESLVPIVTIVLLVASVILFTLLILRDGVKSLRSKAHWISGDFLVLSALTIQLLNLVSTQGQPLNWEKRDILLVEFWMIHTSRILLCVVIAYLIPAMANPGAEDFWGKISSLAITVFLHVITELYFIKPSSASDILKSLWPRQQGTSLTLYYILAALMFSSFVLLLLHLGCANIAGRGIERIVANRSLIVLKKQEKEKNHPHPRSEEDHNYESRCVTCWKNVEDSVLRAWIIARAYSLEYVIARSPLAASAATIVTLQIAITIVAGVMNSPKLLMCETLDQFRFAITMMQCVFILIGWSMILWRWVTAVVYYDSSSTGICIEDFWTRHLTDLQEAQRKQPAKQQLLEAKIEKVVVNQSTKISIPWYLLYVVIYVQWFTVFLSKACWLPSLMTGMLMSPVISKLKEDCREDTDRKSVGAQKSGESNLKKVCYKDMEPILKGLEMLGETWDSLWLYNHHSIREAKRLIIQGEEDGTQDKCKQDLVNFVATKKTGQGLGLSCLDPSKAQAKLNFICKNGIMIEQEQITDMGRKQWKMTAVSLITIIAQLSRIRTQPGHGGEQPSTSCSLMTVIAQLSPNCAQSGGDQQPSSSTSFPQKVMKDCLNAYSEAWDIIDFVDRADEEDGTATREVGDEIISEAADKYFSLAKHMERKEGYWIPFRNPGQEGDQPPHTVTDALAKLKTESCKGKTETPGATTNASDLKGKHEKAPQSFKKLTGSDSTDWKEAAWKKAVYKLCINMACSEDTNLIDLMEELERCLADIIYECLNKTQHLLLLNCRKWALKNGERNIARALYTAGKTMKIMETLSAPDTEGKGKKLVETLSAPDTKG